MKFSEENIKLQKDAFGIVANINNDYWYQVIGKYQIFGKFLELSSYYKKSFTDTEYTYISKLIKLIFNDQSNPVFAIIYLMHIGCKYMFGSKFKTGDEYFDNKINDCMNDLLKELNEEYKSFIKTCVSLAKKENRDVAKTYIEKQIGNKIFILANSDMYAQLSEHKINKEYLFNQNKLDNLRDALNELRKKFYNYCTPDINYLCDYFGVGKSTYRSKIKDFI